MMNNPSCAYEKNKQIGLKVVKEDQKAESDSTITNVRPSVRLSVRPQNPLNLNPSSFNIHPSSFFSMGGGYPPT